MRNGTARVVEKTEIKAKPEEVFAFMDDIRNVGWHMEGGRSMALFGGKLTLDTFSEQDRGVGATYRWRGKVMGLTIDFAEVVTKWVRNREKVWRTLDGAKIIIMSGYEMRFNLTPTDDGTLVTFEIEYEPPRSWLGRIVGKILARRYSKWCLRRAVGDAKRILELSRPPVIQASRYSSTPFQPNSQSTG